MHYVPILQSPARLNLTYFEDDGIKLSRDYGVRAQGLVELGGLARQADADYVERYFKFAPPPKKSASPIASSASASASKEKEAENNGNKATGEPPAPKMRKPGFMISLATITAMYTEHSLSKGPVRTSNWEVQPLRENQLECEPFASSLPFFHYF